MPPISRVTPFSQSVSYNRVGSPPSLQSLIVTVIEDYEVLYMQYYFQFENTSVNWLEAPGLEDTSYIPYDSGDIGELPLALKNLDLLPAGNYKGTIFIEFSNADGYGRKLFSTVNLSLTGNPATQIATDKATYELIYNRMTNTLSGDTLVNIVNASGTIVFESIGSLLLEKSTVTDSFTLEEDPAFPFSTNAELPASGLKQVICRLKKDGIYVCVFTVNILVIETEDITVEPSEFKFVLRKGLNETMTQVMNIVNPMGYNFTIQAPVWLNLSALSGNSTTAISLTTVNSETISPAGTYNADLLITYNNKTLVVKLVLEVLNFSILNLSDYNFCLDDIFLKINKFYENARFVRITVDMQIFSDEGFKTYSSQYFIPYFNDKASTNIGEKIQNYFPIFKEEIFQFINGYNNLLVYRPLLTQIKVEEVDINYAVLHTQTFSDVRFFAGNRPKLFPLFTNHNIRRRYKDSVHFFSYFTGLVSPEDFTGVPTADNPATNFEVQTVALKDSEISFPDMKENFDLDFLEFPDVEKKVLLQWLNNNLVPEWFLFSGDYKMTTEFEHSYDNFMINGKKYETKELSKLTIYTGFILKEEKETVKEIIKSLFTYIRIEDEIYNCLPITPKLVEKDSTESLINIELEFLIVKAKNGN